MILTSIFAVDALAQRTKSGKSSSFSHSVGQTPRSGNNVVDAGDYTIWRQNIVSSAGKAAASNSSSGLIGLGNQPKQNKFVAMADVNGDRFHGPVVVTTGTLDVQGNRIGTERKPRF